MPFGNFERADTARTQEQENPEKAPDPRYLQLNKHNGTSTHAQIQDHMYLCLKKGQLAVL